MGSENGRCVVKSGNKDADLFVDREIERPEHMQNPAGSEPASRCGNQGGSGLGVVEAIKEAKMTARVVVALKVSPTDLGGDTADREITAVGNETLRFTKCEEWVVFGGNAPLLLDQKRGHPGRIVREDLIGYAQPIPIATAIGHCP